MTNRIRMTNVDAAWLQMESPTNLMMITGILTFEQPIAPADFRAVLQRGLVDAYPRFRQRVVRPFARLGALYWEDDPHFDLGVHIHHIGLPAPGDQAALQALVSAVMSTPLDLTRPPWHFYLVDGFGDGCAVVARLHHCIADGIALARVLLSLTEEANGDEAVSGEESGKRERSRPSAVDTVRKVAERVASEGLAVVGNPDLLQDYAAQGLQGVAAFNKLVLSWPDPPTIYKGRLGVTKRAAWSRPIPLSDVKAIGRTADCTVNDVLIAAMTGALRSYMAEHGKLVDNFRAAVPFNLRPLDGPIELGNQFGLVFLSLPVGLADPLDRLLEVKQRMDAIKNSPEAAVAFGLLNAIGMTPPIVEKQFMRLFGAKLTAVMTNVPGPRGPITLAGSQVSSLICWVPQSGGLGLGVSIISYNGGVFVGVATDAGLVPDPDRVIEAFYADFEQMLALVAPQPDSAV